MSIQVGSVAPDFNLFDTEKTQVSLHAQKGKPVVLLFFLLLLPVCVLLSFVM